MTVKRYDLVNIGESFDNLYKMEEDFAGDYVLYSDYKSLEEKLAKQYNDALILETKKEIFLNNQIDNLYKRLDMYKSKLQEFVYKESNGEDHLILQDNGGSVI